MTCLQTSIDPNGVATLNLARPDRGNALDAELVEALLESVRDIAANPAVHTLALRGQGPHFCTGFDLGDAEQRSDGDLLLRFVRVEELLQALWHAPVRTVAFAHGRAFGAGADLFAACDVRVAHAGATFRFPGVRFGVVLGTRRLAARVGVDRANAILLHGEALDATKALSAGLATATTTDDPTAWLLAREPPIVDRATLAAVRERTRPPSGDEDLAALVRSAARPGLAQRIADYRSELARARQR